MEKRLALPEDLRPPAGLVVENQGPRPRSGSVSAPGLVLERVPVLQPGPMSPAREALPGRGEPVRLRAEWRQAVASPRRRSPGRRSPFA